MPVTSTAYIRTTIILLLAGFITILAIVAASLWLVERTDESTGQLVRMQELRRQVFRVLVNVQDAETGQRGYMLTLQQPYLGPYIHARDQLTGDLRRLQDLAAANPRFEKPIDDLSAGITAKLRELQETVDLVNAGRLADAVSIVRSGRGREAMMAIMDNVDSLIELIDADLAVTSHDLRGNIHTLNWVQIAGSIFVLCVVGGSTGVAWRHTRDLDRARLEVQELNAGLEERVRERTADLQRANEEVQRFAYIVSHDLRAPLVNIMGFTSELEAGLETIREHLGESAAADGEGNDPVRQAVEEDMPEAIGFIRSSTGKMDNLINAILRLSREGRRTLAPERIDMAELLQNASDSVQHQVTETGGEISVETPVPDIVSDRLALEQIFGNLIDNAVKYFDPSRPIEISLRGRQIGFQVIYEVEDNGRGIAAEDKERVFELFRRAGNPSNAGEGIGLTHVRALARRLGGDVELESELGRGTIFRVRLPKSLPHSLRDT